jgi:hypothetical protein
MLSEMKKDVTNSKTKQVEQRWVRIGGRPNHLWDCECIALASAMLAGVLPIGAESSARIAGRFHGLLEGNRRCRRVV